MILGIGVTRLLSSGILLLRNRDLFKLDAVSIAWAAFIFVAQIQFWWAIIELAKVVRVWTLASFVMLLSMPLLLFVSAALILPHEARERDLTLSDVFARDGRLALISLAAYNGVALIVDKLWWSASLINAQGAGLLALVILPLWLFVVSRRWLQIAITAAYALVLMFSDIAASPTSYD